MDAKEKDGRTKTTKSEQQLWQYYDYNRIIKQRITLKIENTR